MARPVILLSPDQVREVETLAALLSEDQIADYFGICRTTFRAIRARDPEVDEHYKRGKAKAIAHVANGLLQKARAGDTTSMIFYLKTQAGWRETAGPGHGGGQAIPILREGVSPVDRLRTFVDEQARRLRIAGEADRAV